MNTGFVRSCQWARSTDTITVEANSQKNINIPIPVLSEHGAASVVGIIRIVTSKLYMIPSYNRTGTYPDYTYAVNLCNVGTTSYYISAGNIVMLVVGY